MIFNKSWYIAVTAISIFRFFLILVQKLTPEHPNLHLNLFILGAILSASCWGIIDSFLMPSNNILQQMIIIIIVSGVSAGTMQTLQANLMSAILFVIVSVLPLCIWLFMQVNFEYFILGVTATIFILFCSLSAFKGNRLINQVLNLNFKNLELASRLYASNDELTNDDCFWRCRKIGFSKYSITGKVATRSNA